MQEGGIEYFSCYGSNRFKLVILASQRAHELGSGACTAVDRNGDKNTVVALREMAAGQLDLPAIFRLSVQRCKKYLEEFSNSEDMALMSRQTLKNAQTGRNFRERGLGSVFLDQDSFFSRKGKMEDL